MKREEAIEKLKHILKYRSEVEVCLLFGSAAEKNDIPERSDYDIAVCGNQEFETNYLADLQLDLSEVLKRDVDLLDLSRLDGLILMKVLTSGQKIVNKKPELLARHIKRMLFYREDMYPNYRMMQEAKIKRFAYGS